MKIAAISTQLKAIQIDRVWEAGYDGRGVGIAVLDSGRIEHPDLAHRVRDYHDSTSPTDFSEKPAEHAVAVGVMAAGDGTLTRGMLAGAAPGAHLLGIKVAGSGGRITPQAVLDGVNWAIENQERYNIRVMNMSFYIDGWDEKGKQQVYQAVRQASERGIIAVVSAGNEGEQGMNPGLAELDCAVTVAASQFRQVSVNTPADKLNGSPVLHSVASFSGRGAPGRPQPNVTAPGNEIVSGTPDGGYGRQSGTSFSAPLVSGVLATWVQANPTLGVQDVQQILAETSLPISGESHQAQGCGVIQAKNGLDLALTRKGQIPLHLLDTPLERWTGEQLSVVQRNILEAQGK
jgi:serine protease AprX